ncbi:hypothetical protein M472_16145 [Sphingobacterium paucimobilis HER1398]|uniref:Uncharacterized protein n=1 Tax=Sphingobacterium paucimobilis HER1398 TaxID=1346330 RepID=U2IYP8_9SPHI|nr:hypothetical protein M472_03575 [Sphingobacterium paucimobilis HER1398]ERJ60290.1 hypothetical protein M472_16145 [Sphingobacterium paucimobilis HER1398]
MEKSKQHTNGSIKAMRIINTIAISVFVLGILYKIFIAK